MRCRAASALLCFALLCFSLLGPRDVPKINMDQRAGHVASGGVARRWAGQLGRGADCVVEKMKLVRGELLVWPSQQI